MLATVMTNADSCGNDSKKAKAEAEAKGKRQKRKAKMQKQSHKAIGSKQTAEARDGANAKTSKGKAKGNGIADVFSIGRSGPSRN